MKTLMTNKLSKAICLTAVVLIATSSAFAYPPDNAAVLYYRACLFYPQDDVMKNAINDFVRGDIKLNDKITKYVETNRHVIDFAVTAADVSNCDWGIDYSRGLSVLMPHLSIFRDISRLILAEAKIFAIQGDYEAALDRCLSIKKMARHVNEGILINHLVGISLDALANGRIQEFLAEMPQDLKTLNWLKAELMDLAAKPISCKAAMNRDTQAFLIDIRIESKEKVLGFVEDEVIAPCKSRELAVNRLREADEDFFARNRTYWNNHLASVFSALDMPYEQAYHKFRELDEKPGKEYVENPDATITAICWPATAKLYSVGIKAKTLSNAIRTAVEIYIIKTKTGNLPEALPASLPKDVFSNKDFEYEKTAEGFILRCQGKDLLKDKIHEYEFKVQK